MKVYVFGNSEFPGDSAAVNAASYLANFYPEIQFIYISPNEDVPFAGDPDVLILDVIQGLKKPELIEGDKAGRIVAPPRATVHDYDLGFQLKYLRKINKLGNVKIIGIPENMDVTDTESRDYFSIHSIFKKLVAQDIQGS